MSWKIPLAVGAVVAAGTWMLVQGGPDRDTPEAPGSSLAGTASVGTAGHVPHVAAGAESGGAAATWGGRVAAARSGAALWQAAPLDAASTAVVTALDRLSRMPPGEEAMAFARQIEDNARPEQLPGFLQALFTSEHPAVVRSAMAVLARLGDAVTMRDLAENYGVVSSENRGRIHQVVELASNPAALEGLSGIVEADSGERGSPLSMSSMAGIAHTGSAQGVQYLLDQLATRHADYAILALERVTSPAGLDLIRAAGEGRKDAEAVGPYQQALLRIVENASPGS